MCTHPYSDYSSCYHRSVRTSGIRWTKPFKTIIITNICRMPRCVIDVVNLSIIVELEQGTLYATTNLERGPPPPSCGRRMCERRWAGRGVLQNAGQSRSCPSPDIYRSKQYQLIFAPSLDVFQNIYIITALSNDFTSWPNWLLGF